MLFAASGHAASIPVAVNEVAATSGAESVAIDLAAGGSGQPARVEIVGAPTKGRISAVTGTRVVYVPDACGAGTESFRFTLSNAAGVSAPATATVTVAAPASGKTAVFLVDPFLIGQLDLPSNLTNLVLDTLYKMRNWKAVAAAGLDADGASATIAITQTNNCAADVRLTVSNGAALLPYDPKFLTSAPGAGASSLTIPAANLVKVGSVYFAAALVQAPAVGAAHSFTTPVTVTAAQGAAQSQATMALAPPPVVLVHGLWGDQTSLKDVQAYLLATPPWQQSTLVDAICYSPYLAFDAATDPLSSSGDSCEVTSKTALDVEIGHLMAVLDKRHIVGGRIDVVAHSMGGLVARHYSAQKEYFGVRNRRQGAFHELVTLDTPELGSTLATYLYNHAESGLEAPVLSGPWNLWESQCDSGDSIRSCFNKLGLPLAAGSQSIDTGAIHSLIPGGRSLSATPDPKIPGTIWRAVTATWSQNDRPSSLLRSVLNTLIRAIYPGGQTPADTSGILGTNLNDVVVTTASQTADAQYSYNFKDLAHTKTPNPSIFSVFFDGVNQNVEESASVDRLTACWLANVGDMTCPQVLAPSHQATPAVASHETQPAKFLASDRLTLGAASRSPQFGVPFELPLRFGAQAPRAIVVSQSDAHGEIASGSGPVSMTRQVGDTGYVTITPQRFGPMTFTVAATFADGGVALRKFTTDVQLPRSPPTAFTAGRDPMVIVLDSAEPVAMLAPEATYPDIGAIRLEPRQVTAAVEQGPGAPVVRVEGGMIRALRPGTATIAVRFAGLTDLVHVVVKPTWE
jgi:hypothetical protein